MKTIRNYVKNAISACRKWRWKRSACKYFEHLEPEEKLAEQGLQVVDQDRMPPDVATERLCAVGVRMTNSERKMFQEVRSRFLVPAHLARKPVGKKLLRRYGGASLVQLSKWINRAKKRRRGLQHRYEILVALEDSEETRKAKKVLDFHAAGMDLAIEVIEAVINWRKGLATGNPVKAEVAGIMVDPIKGRKLIWTENLPTRALGHGEHPRKSEFPRWVPLCEK